MLFAVMVTFLAVTWPNTVSGVPFTSWNAPCAFTSDTPVPVPEPTMKLPSVPIWLPLPANATS